jgi:hypothetical protein
MGQIKINEKVYTYKLIMIQPTLGSHATIYLTFDINQFKEYKKEFFDFYDNRETFKIITNKFTSEENIIKTVDFDINKNILNLTIKTDILRDIEIGERRDQIIDDILNSTFDDKQNIN